MIPVLWTPGQKDGSEYKEVSIWLQREFKAIPDYTVRHCHKQTKNEQVNKWILEKIIITTALECMLLKVTLFGSQKVCL